MCLSTAMRPISSKNSQTRFTFAPGSRLSTSRMRRRGSLESAANTASIWSGFICHHKVTYRTARVKTRDIPLQLGAGFAVAVDGDGAAGGTCHLHAVLTALERVGHVPVVG